MILESFEAENFRNIASCSLHFSPGVNVLIGENAQGKTNVIEGIYLFSRGKSFRAHEDREMVAFGSEGFRLGISYCDGGKTDSLEYAMFGKERRRKKNGYPLKSVSEMIGNFRSVLFSPDDLGFVKDGPEARRNFLNIALAQIDKRYLVYYSQYKNAVENRNCLLKNACKGLYVDMNEFYSWSRSMADYASYIHEMRLSYIKKIEKYASKIMREMTDGEEKLSLSYLSEIKEEYESRELLSDAYLALLTRNSDKEKAAGVSLYGPHRDDIDIRIGTRSARLYASQGQQRSVVLTLKLAEGEVIRDLTGEYPVFLFDDVLSELDDRRRSFLFQSLGERQILITSCEKETGSDLPDGRKPTVITVKEGNYSYDS